VGGRVLDNARILKHKFQLWWRACQRRRRALMVNPRTGLIFNGLFEARFSRLYRKKPLLSRPMGI
jgi:hypothetical protein